MLKIDFKLVKTLLIILLSVLTLVQCTDSDTQDTPDQYETISVNNRDSSMVAQLIDQSQTTYADNASETPPFDNYLKEAESIAKKNSNQEQLFDIYMQVGLRYRNKSLYGDAMQYLEQALSIAESTENLFFQTRAYNQIGVVLRRIDDNTEALDMHMKSLQIAELCNDSLSISKAINGLGNVCIAMERYHSAIEYFRRGLHISELMNNKLGMAINTNNIGEAYLKLNHLDSAMTYYFKSLEYNSQINSRVGQSICYNSIGSTYIAKDQNRLALDYLFKALEINLAIGDRMHIAVSYTQIGKTYLNDNRIDEAINYLDKGLNTAISIGSKYTAEEAAALLSEAYEKKGINDQALAYYKLATTYKDSVLNERNLFHLASIEVKYKNTLQELEIEELNKEALLQKTLLSKQRSLIAAIAILVFVLITAVIMIIFQGRLRNRYRNLKFQQRLLRSQMNPHFIFNALSAIQVFILENDMHKSSQFLSHFSKLMRHVLRSSNYEFIPVQEEVETLEHYIKIQQLRFHPSFDYQFVISDEVKKNKVVIPPMLVQPFVENAIEHGIKTLGEGGNIFIRFIKDGNNLVLEIEDNGLGLDYNDRLSHNDRPHESMAIKITNERLSILERDMRQKTHFELYDKKKKDPFDRGTIARITIPYTTQEAK